MTVRELAARALIRALDEVRLLADYGLATATDVTRVDDAQTAYDIALWTEPR